MNEHGPRTVNTDPLLSSAEIQRIASQTLFGTRREVVIVHNGREYRLRLTQNDKLILTA